MVWTLFGLFKLNRRLIDKCHCTLRPKPAAGFQPSPASRPSHPSLSAHCLKAGDRCARWRRRLPRSNPANWRRGPMGDGTTSDTGVGELGLEALGRSRLTQNGCPWWHCRAAGEPMAGQRSGGGRWLGGREAEVSSGGGLGGDNGVRGGRRWAACSEVPCAVEVAAVRRLRCTPHHGISLGRRRAWLYRQRAGGADGLASSQTRSKRCGERSRWGAAMQSALEQGGKVARGEGERGLTKIRWRRWPVGEQGGAVGWWPRALARVASSDSWPGGPFKSTLGQL
jgi:hypothetical protein